MTNCEYCDYYRNVIENIDRESNVTLCTFANVILLTDAENLDTEYPCKDITYQQYLDRRKSDVSNSRIMPADWRFMYKSKHPVCERKRSSSAVV